MKVKWSRSLPAQPSSVTVIKDAAGRYFASLDTDPGADGARMPDTGQRVGIDLGGPCRRACRPPSRQERRHRSTDRMLTRSSFAITVFFSPRAKPSTASMRTRSLAA